MKFDSQIDLFSVGQKIKGVFLLFLQPIFPEGKSINMLIILIITALPVFHEKRFPRHTRPNPGDQTEALDKLPRCALTNHQLNSVETNSFIHLVNSHENDLIFCMSMSSRTKGHGLQANTRLLRYNQSIV